METSEPQNAPRRCPKCDAHEHDPTVTNCRSCGGLLAQAALSMHCPRCGPRRGDSEVCSACGTRLIIGAPVEECYPERPFSDGMRPVILLEGRRETPTLSLAAGHSPGGEECESGAPKIKGLNLTTEKAQMEGVPKDHVHLAVGETVTVYARGLDESGKWCQLPESIVIKWRHDRDLTLLPGPGQTASVKLVGNPKVSAVATARTTAGKKKLQRTFTVEKI
jgi:hypothetical protein